MSEARTRQGLLKAVLFDLGGTLVSYGSGEDVGRPVVSGVEPLIREGLEGAYRYLKEKMSPLPHFEKFSSRLTRRLKWGYFLSRLSSRELDASNITMKCLEGWGISLSPEEFEGFVEAWYHPFSLRARLVDGAEEVVAALRGKGYRLGIVSNTLWPGKVLERDLARLGLRSAFVEDPEPSRREVLVFSSDFGYRKPSPKIFRHALSQMRVEAHEAVFVGDSLKTDVLAAMAVGMKAVLIETCPRAQSLPPKAPLPYVHIEHLRQLPRAIEALASCAGGEGVC